MVAVQIGEHGRDVVTEYAQQRQVGVLDDGDGDATLPRGRGDLEADPAGTDNDHPRAIDQLCGDPVAVGQRPQVQHAVQIGTGNIQEPRRRAGGQQQRVVADPLSVRHFDLSGGPVDRSHRGARAQVDVVFGVPAGIVHEHRVPIGLSQQQTLGQRRPFIGPFGLLAQQDDIAVEAFVPQRLRGLRPGEPGSDYHERTLVVHGLVPFGMPLRRFRSYQRRGGSAAREGSVLRTAKVPCLQRSSGGGSWQHMPPDEIGPTSCRRPATRHHTSGRYPGGGEAAPPRPFPVCGLWKARSRMTRPCLVPPPSSRRLAARVAWRQIWHAA